MGRFMVIAWLACSLVLSFLVVSPNSSVAQFWNDIAKSWNNYVIKTSAPHCSQPVYRINTAEKIVAITLDDGPNPHFTLPMLEIFKQRNVKATFFIVGAEAVKYPDIVREIKKRGHQIANHTMSHPEMQNISQPETLLEIKKAEEILYDITGGKSKYFRPPKGIINAISAREIHKLGYTIVMWDVSLENMNCKTPGEMAHRALKKVKPGSIILLHDGRLDRTKSVHSLPILLDGLIEMGYSFVTINDLLTSIPCESQMPEYF